MRNQATPSALSRRDITRAGLCIGCGACITPGSGSAMTMDPFGQLKPAGPKAWHRGADPRLAKICPFSPSAVNEDELAARWFSGLPAASGSLGRVRAAYVGHAAEGEFRNHGSSGGMASWVLRELLRTGRIDGAAHVQAVDPSDGRFFRYRISRCEEEILRGAKSRYYPVEMSEVLRAIRETPGRYAVVGVPCFIKAIRLLCEQDPILNERIRYTLGLFCGHMKSGRLAESFAWQMGAELSEVAGLDYRRKDPSRAASAYTAELVLKSGEVRRRDWWNMPDGDWGAGFFQNSACNYCDDVVAETADIAFGDAWIEPYAADGRGTNVILIRSAELHDLLLGGVAESRLQLESVGEEFVAKTQAAGLRQRREGLAYRLCWKKCGIRARKRIRPDAAGLTLRRKLIYRLRAGISAWSHRIFWLARRLRWPSLYLQWARMAASIYGGCAYFRGFTGQIFRRLDAWESTGIAKILK